MNRRNAILGIEAGRTLDLRMLLAITGIFLAICFDSWNDLMNAFKSGNGYVQYFFWNSGYGGVCRSYLVPIFAALTFSASYLTEYRSNAVPYIIAREGVNRYSYVKYAVTAAAGGLAVSAATVLLFFFLLIRFPMVDSVFQEIPLDTPYHGWLAAYHPVCYIAAEAWLGFLRGFLWAGAALCVSGFILDEFVVRLSPFLLVMMTRQICRILHLPAVFQTDRILTGSIVIRNSGITVCLSTLMVLACSCFQAWLFCITVRRRCGYEWD